MPGVLAVEPFRFVSATLSNGHVSRRQPLQAQADGASMNRLIDAERRPVPIPETGLMLSAKLAEVLGVRAGDTVTVEILEGRRQTVQIRVAGTVETYLGTPAYISLDALNRLMLEGTTVSGARMLVDPVQADALYEALKASPLVSTVTYQTVAREKFVELLDQAIGVQITVNLIFATIIAVGVVYNAARIALAERARELASLRVLGFTKGEVSYILLGELFILTILALPFGAVFGYVFFWFISSSFDSEVFQMPQVVELATYGYAVSVILIAASVSAWLVQRDVARFDLVSVLKTRE